MRQFHEKSMLRGILGMLFAAFFVCFCSVSALADEIELELSYGYQNTAKAGRLLPLTIQIENTTEQTFTGLIHVYMAESENSVYEYQYPVTVEGLSDRTLNVTVSLNSGINQLLATAVSKEGERLGSRRIGLDVSASDAELIIGILSDTPEKLSYLDGVGVNEGVLRTRLVNLNPSELPMGENQLDQLDVLLISNFEMQKLSNAEARGMRSWMEKGGILLIGTGARGDMALMPYFTDLLAQTLQPMPVQLDMGEEYHRHVDGETEGAILTLTAAPVHLTGGRDVILSGDFPVVAVANVGDGMAAVSAYDFCDIQAFCTEQISYVDKLLTAVLGQTRLETLSVSATEKSLNEYWDIQDLMRIGDMRKLPNVPLYLIALAAYVLLAGPGLFFFLRTREMAQLYKPCVIFCSVLSVALVWLMGMNTRFSDTFLTYAKIKNISESSIAETDFINIRSPYNRPYELDVRTEYYVYPVLKGSGYSGDIAALSSSRTTAHTTVDYSVDRSVIRMENAGAFTPKYFQLTNNMPNVDGSFQANLTLFDGELSGTLTNGSVYSLTDAALLLYGKLIPIGRLDAGETVDLSGAEIVNVAVGSGDMLAERIAGGSRKSVLRYYLKHNLASYFPDARLVGFVREAQPGFTDDAVESFGITLVVSSIPLNRSVGGYSSQSALSREPRIVSGDYDIAENTISGAVPTVIEYSLGEECRIDRLQFEYLDAEGSGAEFYYVVPFDGIVSFFNYQSGVFDTMDMRAGEFTAEQLTPYLSEQNVLRIKYTPGYEDSLARAQYLPMIEVIAEETDVPEAAAAAQADEAPLASETQEQTAAAPSEAEREEAADA